jgi:hypothetical protein
MNKKTKTTGKAEKEERFLPKKLLVMEKVCDSLILDAFEMEDLIQQLASSYRHGNKKD